MSSPSPSPTHPYLTTRTILLVLLASTGGLIFGYDLGQIGGFLAMPDFLARFGAYDPFMHAYYFSAVRAGLLVGLLAIGNLFGALIAAPIANRLGRRRSISYWALVYAVGLTVQITVEVKWYQIMAGRFVGGLGIGALSILVPLYVSESSPTHVRGTTVS